MYGYIYLIVNKLDGRTYVGKRKFRKTTQKWDTDNYMGSGPHLKNSQKKHGIENFEKFFITWTSSEEDACKKEKFWIAEYRSRGKAEYNKADGGEGGGWNKGKSLEELFSKEKALEYRKRLSESHKGIPSANKGKHPSEESKRKNAEAHKGKTAWNKGKKGIYSEESLKKMSEHSKNKIPPSQKGKHHYNNGVDNILAFECPEGWVKGWVKI